MKIFRWAILVLLYFTLAQHSQSATQTHEVTAQIISSELIVTNHTSRDTYYAIYESKSLALIEWAPVCTDENRILPKQSIRIPIKPSSFQPSGKAVIFWWNKGRKGPDKVSSLTVLVR
jgi:hypothetical protein